MATPDKEKTSRRKFLTLGLLAGGGLLSAPLAAQPVQPAESKEEMVKMLTADGQLVEVKKSIADQVNSTKVSNKEILDWMKNPSKK